MSKQNTKATIDANIKQNGQQQITGAILNSVLNTMVTDYAEQEKLTELERKVGDVENGIPILVNAVTKYSFDQFEETGALVSSGVVNPAYTTFRTSHFIPLGNVDVVQVEDLYASGDLVAVAWYDSNKTLISTDITRDGYIIPIDGAKYIRCSAYRETSFVVLTNIHAYKCLETKEEVFKHKYNMANTGILYDAVNYMSADLYFNGGETIRFNQYYSGVVGATAFDENDNVIKAYTNASPVGAEITIALPYNCTKLRISWYAGNEFKVLVLKPGKRVDDTTRLDETFQNPLAVIKRENGFASILHKWGIIGTSLDSGEMDADGSLNDFYGFSWGKEFGRINGVDVFNFSEGGQTVKGWLAYANRMRRYGSPSAATGYLYFRTMLSKSSFGYDVVQVRSNEVTMYLTETRLNAIKNEGLCIQGCHTTISDIKIGDTHLSSVEQSLNVGAGNYFRPVSLGLYEKEINIPREEFLAFATGQTLTISVSHYGEGAIGRPMDAYIISLGENDISYGTYSGGAGSLSTDINTTAPYTPSVETFAGYMACLIQRLKDIQPKCKIFVKTLYPFWATHGRTEEGAFNAVIRQLPNYFDNVFVLDLAEYMHTESASEWSGMWLNSHLSPSGYKYLAYVFSTYVDWVIRKEMDSFKDVALIGTNLNV